MAPRSHGRRPLTPPARRAAGLALALLVAALAGGAEPPARPEPIDLLNALLAKLLDLGEVTTGELQDVVADAGGIAFPSEVPVDYLTYAELRQYLVEVVDSEYPPPEADADARTLVAFDLIPPDLDLRQARRDLLEQNIAGFYDERPHRRRLYVVSEDRKLTPMNQLILAHELRHALQDQHADVHQVVPEQVGDFDDRRMAFLAVLEGDATLVMERFLRRRLELARHDVPETSDFSMPVGAMPGTPAVLRDQMVLPYVIGTPFARDLWRKGGWEALREAWSRPPESTEQVLHPEKYWQRERPSPAEIPYAPRDGRVLREGVLGEAFIRTLLGTGTEAAAAGWGGDGFRVWDLGRRHPGKTLMVWRAAWESEADAREFESALSARFARTHGRDRPHREIGVYRTGSWRAAFWRRGADAWLVSSDEGRALRKAMDGLGKLQGGR